jgi:hypothetical protein
MRTAVEELPLLVRIALAYAKLATGQQATVAKPRYSVARASGFKVYLVYEYLSFALL